MLACEIWEDKKWDQRNHKAQMLTLFSRCVLSMVSPVLHSLSTHHMLTMYRRLRKALYLIDFVVFKEPRKM